MVGSSCMEVEKPDGSKASIGFNSVSSGYLQSLGLRLLKGRWLPERQEGVEVVVLNESMAKQWFGAEDPIGRRIALWPGKPWEVIGLVPDVRDQVRKAAGPQCYYPHWQNSSRSDVISLLLDLSIKPNAALIQSIRKAIFEVEPQAGIRTPVELEKEARKQIALERFTLLLLHVVAILALLLAVLGVFSVMIYNVTLRKKEFGIRIALGASPRQLFHSVLKHGLLIGGIGVLAGLGLSWALTRFIQSLLYETSPLDLGVYAGMSFLLLLATLFACLIPARCAAKTDPMNLLRAE